MKFNLKKYILTLGIASVLLPSCNDDFMERYPLDEITDESFLENRDRSQANVKQSVPIVHHRPPKWMGTRQKPSIKRCRQPAYVRGFLFGQLRKDR